MKYIISAALTLALMASSSALATTTGKTQKSSKSSAVVEQYRTQIRAAEIYLSDFKTLKAQFTQIIPGANVQSRGLFFISRPGKARWEYHKPVKTLLVVKDNRISYYDYDLDQVTFGDVPESPLEVLLKSEVKLIDNPQLEVTNVQEDSNTLSITVRPTGITNRKNSNTDFMFDANSNRESLTLVFGKNPLTLKRLKRTDENNTSTLLELSQMKFNDGLPEDLFVFNNPKIFKKKKHN